jgi:hypothetical protein
VIERCRDLIGNNMAHEDYRATAMNYLATAQAGTKDPATVAYYGFLRVIDHAPSLFTHLFSFSRVPETIRDIDWRLIRKWSRVCQEQQ